MLYPQQTWTVTGEQTFENGGYILLNPAIKVTQVVFQAANRVSLSLLSTENGGVYHHIASCSYLNQSGETDVDLIVNAAMAENFPDATVDPPLAQLRNA